ncbi:MAG: hypothetical protein ABSB42_16325 [Tepidisphaeraceae bacterium]|jgi:hypothetical protein
MFASLKNRMTRTLVVALVPASLSLVLVSNSFAQANSRIDSIQTDGPGGSGYCLATASDRVADDDDGPGLGGGYCLATNSNHVADDDDGPGLGGGYITSATPTPIALDGPGSSDPYVLD